MGRNLVQGVSQQICLGRGCVFCACSQMCQETVKFRIKEDATLGPKNPHITATVLLDTQQNTSFEWFQMAPIHKHILTNSITVDVEQLCTD